MEQFPLDNYSDRQTQESIELIQIKQEIETESYQSNGQNKYGDVSILNISAENPANFNDVY